MYRPSVPLVITYTGIALAANSPQDVATIPISNTGCRYMTYQGNSMIACLASTVDIGSVGVGYAVWTGPNQGGSCILTNRTTQTLNQGDARFFNSYTVSGNWTATGVTIRQVNDSPATGLVALSFSILPII